MGAYYFQYAPSGAPWAFSGSAGIAGNISGFTWYNPSAPEGGQVAFLQGVGSVGQSLAGFQAGVQYTLTVAAAQRSGNSQVVQVQLDGQAIGTFTPSGSAYADYTIGPFAASAGSHTLSFAGLNPNGGDNTAFLDNVRLVGPNPDAPTGLTASPGDGRVSLSWNAGARASGYTVYRGTAGGGPFAAVASGVAGTAYTDTGLTDGTTYYYYVTATDALGESANSLEASATPQPPVDKVWVEDAVPAGASLGSDESNGWSWTGSDPAPYAGSLASPSSVTAGEHLHCFYGAADTLTVPPGGTLFAYVYLDPANPPSEVMLQWNDGSWEHRAYWGADDIGWGYDGTASRRYAGPLPASGAWVRLEVPAASVGLEGRTLNGLAFTLYDGRATWDHAGASSTPSAPAPPGPLQASAGGGQVTLSWPASAGATGYTVYRGTAGGGPFAAVAPGITATTYLDAGLTDGQAYYYYVTATNVVGESGSSNEVTATPINRTPTLTAAPGDGSAALSWSSVSGAHYYSVYRSTTSGGPYSLVANVGGTSDTDGGLQNGVTYYYVVQAVDSGGGGPYSNEASAAVSLASPSPLTAVPGDGNAALSWSAVPNAHYYSIYRSTTSGGPYSLVANVGGTTDTDGGLSNGTTYYYVVQAMDGGGGGALSNEASAAIGLASPSPLTATPGHGAAILSWTGVPNAHYYMLFRSTTSGGPYSLVTNVGGSTTNYTDGGLQNGVTYYYVVQAVDGGGGGALSNELPFTPTLAAPGNLRATSGSGNIALSWDAVPNADGYTVYRSMISGGPYSLVNNVSGSTSYTDGGPKNNTLYYYVVRAYNSGGRSVNSNEAVGAVVPELATASAALLFSHDPAAGGAAVTGLIVLGAPAPTGGEAFTLASGGPAASVPASVAVAGGSSLVTFPITTSAVEADTTVTLTAAPASGQALTATLTLLPAFSLAPNAAALTLAPGGGTSSTIEISSPGGYAGPVTLSLSGLPPGLTAWFYPPTALLAAPPPGASLSGISSTLFLSYPAGATVPSGPYALTVTGTSGTFTTSAPLTLTIP